MKRKICVVTGSRAEYGLLRWMMEDIQSHPQLDLQIIVTGMHLSPEFGLTYRNIEDDGFYIQEKIEMLLSSDTSIGLTKSMGLGLIGFGEALMRLQPDLMLLLGDRFEMFSAAAAALISRIPVAHLHGGEVTEGAYDESIRHSITKMSHLHFVAAEEYRQRVIQMGETPDRVFLVGGLGIDSINRISLLDRVMLERELNFKFGKRNLLVTFHPVTLEQNSSESQMRELLNALDKLEETHLIFTMPNADTDSRILFNMIESYVSKRPNACAYKSLGQKRYLSCLKYVDGVIGNSSSGLIEAPSLHKGTINIGNRQKGRLKAESVIDCLPTENDILSAVRCMYSQDFQANLKNVKNPYGDGGASARILNILLEHRFDNILNKSFYSV